MTTHVLVLTQQQLEYLRYHTEDLIPENETNYDRLIRLEIRELLESL